MQIREILIVVFSVAAIICAIIVAIVLDSRASKKRDQETAKENAALVERFLKNEALQKFAKIMSDYCLKEIFEAYRHRSNTSEHTIRITPYGIALNPWGVRTHSSISHNDHSIVFQKYDMEDILDYKMLNAFEVAFRKQFEENIISALASQNIQIDLDFKFRVTTRNEDEDDKMTDVGRDLPAHKRRELGVDPDRSRYLYYTFVFGYRKNEW